MIEDQDDIRVANKILDGWHSNRFNRSYNNSNHLFTCSSTYQYIERLLVNLSDEIGIILVEKCTKTTGNVKTRKLTFPPVINATYEEVDER